MPDLTPEGQRIVAEIAGRHGVGREAAFALLDALALGGGAQAQFNHPDLGGMGQWSQGGMIMVGDMFNQQLKHRVDELCNELAGLLRDEPSIRADAGLREPLFAEGSGSGSRWWPAGLGDPASVGAQNDMRYAFFPQARRVAIQQGGRLRIYDSGEHRLSGFSQQQSRDQSLTFNSQSGVVSVADLAEVSSGDRQPPGGAPDTRAAASASGASGASAASRPAGEILATIERLAGLRDKKIITEQEFSAKKAELLNRL